MTLEIRGRIPSKKNSKRLSTRGGHVVLLPSAAHEEWHLDASMQIAPFRPKVPFERCELHVTIYAPDRRAGDLTNKAESIHDLLVDCGFLVDDNWNVVPKVTLEFGGVDRENPRALVSLLCETMSLE